MRNAYMSDGRFQDIMSIAYNIMNDKILKNY